jgi:DNA-binding PadR family transcriptional regulator
MLSKRLAGAALRPLVLSLLARGPKYGFQISYQIRTLLDDDIQLPNSKLYPMLHGLERDGAVESYWEPSEDGPDRKYYRLTESGRTELQAARAEWSRVHGVLKGLAG